MTEVTVSILAEESSDGYAVEVRTRTYPDGTTSKSTTILDARTLILREVAAIRAQVGEEAVDNQELIRRAALAVAAAGRSKGHVEAPRWFIEHKHQIEALMADPEDVDGASYKSPWPLAHEYVGLADANSSPDAGVRGFDSINEAARRSVRSVGKYEWDSDCADRRNWSSIAENEVRKAHSYESSKSVDLGDQFTFIADSRALEQAKAQNAILELDIPGLAREAELDCEEAAYLRHGGDLGSLGAETGDDWDQPRAERVRKRLAYHWPRLTAIARNHWVQRGYGASYKEKMPNVPSGVWTFRRPQ